MKPYTFAFAVGLLILAATGLVVSRRPPLPPPAPLAPQPPVRTFTVVGEGVVRVPPEVATIRFTIENAGPTIPSAQGLDDAARLALTFRLDGLRVQPEDIEVVGTRVRTEPADERAGPVTTVRRVATDMQVRVRELDRLPLVRDAIALAMPVSMEPPRYDLLDPDKTVREAEQRALADARDHANALAQMAGVKLALATQTTVLEPLPGAEAPPALEGGTLMVRARVQVTYST